MNSSICGVDCTICQLKDTCSGCVKTNGHPFMNECVLAKCCTANGYEYCSKCYNIPCKLKKKLIDEFNALKIQDIEEVMDLNALKGSFVNIEYCLSNGQKVKLLEDEKIYLGNQLCKKNSSRCYGLVADEDYLLVCEYDEGGLNPEIIIYKKRVK